MLSAMRAILLDNIRSHYNVGAIFRTADAAAVAKVYLAGYTPQPIDRFGRVVPEIAKTSLGASESVPWEYVENVVDFIKAKKQEGISIVAVEQGEGSVSLFDFVSPKNVIYILGNEIEGVQKELLALADSLLEIPMAGEKESLNVSVTAGIVLFKNPASYFE